jgi:hypothetical protein
MVSDFKTNIQIVTNVEPNLLFAVDKLAEEFIKKECTRTELFCDEIEIHDRKYFKTERGESLFLFGYRFKTPNPAMEEESSSFFVFGINQADKVIDYDIASDLVFEIQLKLAGFEMRGDTKVIWGEMYPYTEGIEYGKFRLTLSETTKTYEFQCKGHDH